MTDKKKTYLIPEMKVVMLDQADIIATSTGGQINSLRDDNSYNELF